LSARGFAHAAWSVIRGVARSLFDTYRLGGTMFLVAPAIVAISALPEFAQHVAEILLGMFDSREAARSVADSPVRWGFGYVKIAGLVLAMLLTARFWASGGSVRRAFLVSPMILVRTAAAIAVMVLSGVALDYLARQLPPLAGTVVTLFAAVLQAGLSLWAIAQLLEDREVTLRRSLTTHLPTAALLLLLFAAAMAPAQLLHGLNHRLALGQPDALVWGLMVFDSLLVGLMAVLAGSGFYVAFRAAPTWRGWTRTPGAPGGGWPLRP
jgi:hypothetical protein